MSLDSARQETAGRLVHAAINFLQVALTSLDPNDRWATAPMPTPPDDWPLHVILWKPTFSDPARMLVEAGELMTLAHELIGSETSFDDRAPKRGHDDDR